jgi:ribosomal protein S27AE
MERDRGEKGTGETVTQVIERVEAHYEVQRVEEMDTLYRWCPESVVIECECGERATLAASRSACGECGADHEAIIEEVLNVRQEDKVEHPWRSVRPSCYAPGPERFVPSSGRITLEGECGERLVLLGREEDWYLEGRRLFECECGERLTITKNRVSEEANAAIRLLQRLPGLATTE